MIWWKIWIWKGKADLLGSSTNGKFSFLKCILNINLHDAGVYSQKHKFYRCVLLVNFIWILNNENYAYQHWPYYGAIPRLCKNVFYHISFFWFTYLNPVGNLDFILLELNFFIIISSRVDLEIWNQNILEMKSSLKLL